MMFFWTSVGFFNQRGKKSQFTQNEQEERKHTSWGFIIIKEQYETFRFMIPASPLSLTSSNLDMKRASEPCDITGGCLVSSSMCAALFLCDEVLHLNTGLRYFSIHVMNFWLKAKGRADRVLTPRMKSWRTVKVGASCHCEHLDSCYSVCVSVWDPTSSAPPLPQSLHLASPLFLPRLLHFVFALPISCLLLVVTHTHTHTESGLNSLVTLGLGRAKRCHMSAGGAAADWSGR